MGEVWVQKNRHRMWAQNVGTEMHRGCRWLPKPSFCTVAPPRVTNPLWGDAFLPKQPAQPFSTGRCV